MLLLFDKVTALDAIGPYDVLSRLPGAKVTFAGASAGEYRTDNGFLGLVADVAIADVDSADIVLIPGGMGTRALLDNDEILEWIREMDATSEFTTSVCTGSLLLAAAGLLDGRPAATHWAARDLLASLGAIASDDRVVRDGKYVTAAGVSSGIDMALQLAEILTDEQTAQAIQLMIEYDPEPPFDTGSVAKASDAVRKRALSLRDATTA